MTKSQIATAFATLAIVALVAFVLLYRFLDWVFRGSPLGILLVPLVFLIVWVLAYAVEWVTERSGDE